MNWRRGFHFVLLHLLIALPIMVQREVDRWKSGQQSEMREFAVLRRVAFQENLVPFDPIHECRFWKPQEQILIMVNPLADVLVGWNEHQTHQFTLPSVLGRLFGKHSRANFVLTDACFLFSIALQWQFFASLPLLGSRYRWLEPSVLITICAALSCLLLLAPADTYRLPMVIAPMAWFVWLLLLLGGLARLGCRLVRQRLS
jgi:hypothetical protein